MAKAQAREATAASNKKAAVKEAPAEDAENSEGGSDGPVLDLTDAGVKKMIKLAKQRGFVTYDELNEVLPSDEVSSEQIEDIMAMLTDMGINVVETEEESEDTTEVAESAQTGVVKSESNTTTSADRTDDPVRMYLREMGSVELAVARGRNRHRQAHRGRPRDDDRGPVRKPADLPGHHHLARRAERRQDSLRDIIDLEATYAGPEAKAAPQRRARKIEARPQGSPQGRGKGRRPGQPKGPVAAPTITNVGGEGQSEHDEDDEDDDENNLSLAAMEAELAARDGNARHHRRDLQEAAQAAGPAGRSRRLEDRTLSPAQERRYKKLRRS
jgi:RNA polymerase primary sigma factor